MFTRMLLAAALVATARPGAAEVPLYLTHHGRLLGADDTGARGELDLTVRFHRKAVDDIVGADKENNQVAEYAFTDVPVTDGLYTLVIGPLNPAQWDGTEPRWMGIAVGADLEMTPRLRVGSVPFALRARDADRLGGALAESFAPASHVHWADSGDDFAEAVAKVVTVEEAPDDFTVKGDLHLAATSGGVTFPDSTVQSTAGLTGAGTVGAVAKFTAARGLGPSAIIESAGSVGIGTAVPVEKLNVVGNALVTGAVRAGATGSSALDGTQLSLNSGSLKVDGGAIAVQRGSTGPRLQFGEDTSSAAFKLDTGTAFSTSPLLAVQNAGADRLVVQPDGSVGIGTSSPAEALHVAGGRVRSDTGFCIHEDCVTDWAEAAGGSWTSATGGIAYTGGKVGIGTAGPTAPLHVSRADGANLGDYTAKIVNLDITDNEGQGLLIQAGNGVNDSPLRIQNRAGTNLVNFRADGNVGIGTTAPAAALEIRSDATPQLIVGHKTSPDYRVEISHNGTFDMPFGNANYNFNIGGLPRLFLGNNGNVGIGTTSPANKLDVSGNVGVSGEIYRQGTALVPNTVNGNYWNTATGGIHYSGGNVGVGTSSPADLLDIAETSGSSDSQITLRNAGTAGAGIKLISTDTNGREFRIISTGSGNIPGAGSLGIWDGTGSAYRLVVGPSGKVGIGTTAPASRLHVVDPSTATLTVDGRGSGNAAVGELWLAGDTGADKQEFRIQSVGASHGQGRSLRVYDQTAGQFRAWIDGNGNVGIGTTTPQEKLNVFGTNIKPIIGAITQHTVLYPSYDSQTNTGLEIAATAGGGTGAPVLALSTDNNTTTTPYLGGIAFTTRTTASADKRGAMINSIIDADSTASPNGTLGFHTSQAGALTERMRITSTGNVGIGTTSPQRVLHLNRGTCCPELAMSRSDNAADAKNFQFQLDNGGNLNLHMVNDGWTAVTSQMTMLRNGNVGIGTTPVNHRLEVADTADLNTAAAPGTAFTGAAVSSGGGDVLTGRLFWLGHNGGNTLPSGGKLVGVNHEQPNGRLVLYNYTDNNYLMMWTHSGNVAIGTSTTPTSRLELPNTAGAGGEGRAYAWSTYSSQRWKENIEPIAAPLDKVRRLRGVSFNWKGNGKRDMGMIAEEVGEVLPELVSYEENGKDAAALDYARLVALLVEAMKAQQDELERVREEIDRLRAAVGPAQHRLGALK